METHLVEEADGFTPTWTVGDRVAKARHHAGLTLRELAEPLSVTYGTVSNWERNVSPPRPIFLREIARITGVSYRWLLGVEDEASTGGRAPAATRSGDAGGLEPTPSAPHGPADHRAARNRWDSPRVHRMRPEDGTAVAA